MTSPSDDDKREMLRQVRRIQVRTDRMVTDVMAGGYSSVFRGSGIEFDEVREFAEGDELRSVDWNVTARVGRPFVKKFVEERELSVLFVLDLSASMAFGAKPAGVLPRRSVATTAALFVGCVAFAAARNNDKAGLITFTHDVERYVPCKKGRNHVLPDDVQTLLVPVLAHRLLPSPDAAMHQRTPEEALATLLGQVPVPRARA